MSNWKKAGWAIILSELLATYLFVFWIILPIGLGFGVNENLGERFNMFYALFFSCYFMKAFWVGGFIAIIIYIFRGVSCNVNPAVTMVFIFKKKRSILIGTFVIFAQIVAALAAASTIYLLANLDSISWWNESSTLVSLYPKLEFKHGELTLIDFTNRDISNLQFIFTVPSYLLETFFTFILISTVICYKKVGKNWRPLLIASSVVLMQWIGLHSNNISFNPARTIASPIMLQFFTGKSTIQYSIPFLLGEITAAIIFLKIRKEYII